MSQTESNDEDAVVSTDNFVSCDGSVHEEEVNLETQPHNATCAENDFEEQISSCESSDDEYFSCEEGSSSEDESTVSSRTLGGTPTQYTYAEDPAKDGQIGNTILDDKEGSNQENSTTTALKRTHMASKRRRDESQEGASNYAKVHLSDTPLVGEGSEEMDGDMIVEEKHIQQILLVLNGVPWKMLGKALSIRDADLKKIKIDEGSCGAENSEIEGMKLMLNFYFSAADPCLSMFAAISEALKAINFNDVAKKVIVIHHEIKKEFQSHKSSHIPSKSLTQKNRYEQYNESTPFGALMFHTEIPGKNFSNRVGENPALQTFPTTLGECVKVEFCALIPTQYWQWDEESHMFIRLKLPSLGEWKYDCGHFSNYCEVKFKVKDEKPAESSISITVMRGYIFVPVSILKLCNKIVYKYVVYSGKVKRDDYTGTYEHIPSSDKSPVNRMVVIPREHIKTQGSFTVYDLLINPAPTGRNIPFFGKYFSRSSNELNIPFETMCEFGVDVYLNKYRLLYLVPTTDDLEEMLVGNELAVLFQQITTSSFCSADSDWSVSPNQYLFAASWIEKLTDELLESLKQPAVSQLKQLQTFCAGVSLAQFLLNTDVIGNNETNIWLKCSRNLLSLLTPSVWNSKSGKLSCPEFEIIFDRHKPERSSVLLMLPGLCDIVIKADGKYSEWIHGLVLLHYLNEYITPFERVDVKHQGPHFCGLQLNQYEKFAHDEAFAKAVFQDCNRRHYFLLDQCLLWTFCQLCPTNYFNWILEHNSMAAFVITDLLPKKLCVEAGHEHLLTLDEFAAYSRLIDSIVIQLSSYTEEATSQLWERTARASIELLSYFHEQCSERDINVILGILRLSLKASSTHFHLEQADAKRKGIMREYCISMGNEISRWLDRIFSPCFGLGPNDEDKIRNELEVWKKLLTLTPDEHWRHSWKVTIRGKIEARLCKHVPDIKLWLLSKHQVFQIPELMCFAIGNSLIVDIGRGNVKEESLLILFGQNEPSTRMLLNDYFKKRYQFVHLVTLKEVLQWKLWPQYLLIYCTANYSFRKLFPELHPRWKELAKLLSVDAESMDKSCGESTVFCCLEVMKTWLHDTSSESWLTLTRKLYNLSTEQAFTITLDNLQKPGSNVTFLPVDVEVMCEKAIQLFRSTCQKLIDKTVELSEMESIIRLGSMATQEQDHTNEQRNVTDMHCKAVEQSFKLLYECISSCSPALLPDESQLFSALKDRISEYDAFQLMKHKIMIFKERCGTIAADVCKSLHKMLEESEKQVLLSNVCRTTALSDTLEFPCFKFTSDYEAIEMIDAHFVLSESKCDIFLKSWSEIVESLNHSANHEPCPAMLTLSAVRSLVWEPVYNLCEEVIERLQSMTISLKSVQSLFGKMDPDRVNKEVETLTKALNKCRSVHELEPLPVPCIESLKKVQLYNQFCNYEEAGCVLNRLRENMGLTLIELSNAKDSVEVNDDQPLSVIDRSFFSQEVQLLEEIAADPRRKDCIESFCNNSELVKWIKQETAGLAQLQQFVQVVQRNVSAHGEDIRDTLSDLIPVVSAFASLIYDPIERDAGNNVLGERCGRIWEALKETPAMSEIMDSCGKELEYFKYLSAPEAGDIHQSTNIQMEEINEKGTYEVCSRHQTILHSVHDAVRVKVTTQIAEQTIYSLTQLQELHGKLVLIGGPKRNNTNTFLEVLHHVQCIAEILVDLHRSGHTKYIGFKLSFPCISASLMKLESLRNSMNADYSHWKKKVERSRWKNYSLNHFTTKQLLFLREELAQLKASEQHTPSLELLTLLQSVLCKVNKQKIRRSLENVKRPQFEVKRRAVEPSLAMASLRNTQLTAYEQELCKELKAEGYQEQLVTQGISELNMDTKTSPMDKLVEWCKVNKDHGQDFEQHDGSLTSYQKKLCNAVLEELKTVPINDIHAGLHILRIRDNPIVVLRQWCMNNEYEHKKTSEPELDQTVTDERYSEFEEDETPIEEHPNVITLVKVDKYDRLTAIKAVKQCGRNASIDIARQAALAVSIGTYQDPRRSWLSSSFASFKTDYDMNIEEKYIDFDELGEFLEELLHMGSTCISPSSLTYSRPTVSTNRHMEKHLSLKAGCPNLLVTDVENVWKTVLSIYAISENSLLPTFEEVLICTHDTTLEEITMLWKRAVKDPDKKRIFTMVHAEKLSFRTCNKALQDLDVAAQGCNDYRIIVICASGSQECTHVLSRLAPHQRRIEQLSDDKLASYLTQALTIKEAGLKSAALSDDIRSTVRVVVSARPGQGKSLYIERLAEKVSTNFGCTQQNSLVRIPIHGPDVTPTHILKTLNQHSQDPSATFPQILHFDIAHSVVNCVDSVLFSILVLGGIMDEQGHIWRHQLSQLLVVECTLTDVDFHDKKFWKSKDNCALNSSLSLLSLLPVKYCLSPNDVKEGRICHQKHSVIGMDEKIHCGEDFQRVFQYLRRCEAKVKLSAYKFRAGHDLPGDIQSSLSLIIRKMGPNRNPTWSEMAHFVSFLSMQLRLCESSIYCNPLNVDIFPDFKQFVVKLVLQMSEEFTASSVVSSDLSTEKNADNEIQCQTWIETKHPYLLFNEDGQSMTFLGCSFSIDGHLIDIVSGDIIQREIIGKNLRAGLAQNGVEFNEDYTTWNTNKMLIKLANFLGCAQKTTDNEPVDLNPDKTYVLTYDNLMKMLAIQLRFRANIPVIMMGETGCGKTRLLQYLCDVQAKAHNVDNLICLKVHGGTAPGIITAAVEKAKHLARENEKKNQGINTVLFFDEANTTESLELIKEVMCDHCLNGEPITENIKFAAACNPYRRHSPEMLRKLTSFGLGFYDTGNVQNRGAESQCELVYRVLQLPPSMQSLVYDFGNISDEAEFVYITEIIRNHVLQNKHIPVERAEDAIETISEVLIHCQLFIKEQKDECSFVSLRDIIRTLTVFQWFLEKLISCEQLHELLRRQEHEEDMEIQPIKTITRALICAVSACYHVRLSSAKKRDDFLTDIVEHFSPPYGIPGGKNRFSDEIQRIQNVFVNAMEIPKNIACNAALRENIFMMLVCIENCLPLFLVGKPGSSKSLAKSIVLNSMLGQQSRSHLLRNFKHVQVFQYQCSQYTDSDSIVAVFKEAKNTQDNVRKKNSKFVSVVVLEEVGLAEAAPGLPLKTLHPFLEDGTSGLKQVEKTVEQSKRVAFIGISNWALDPAKMNRGLMVARVPPSDDELLLTANGIAECVGESFICQGLKEHFFPPLACMYRRLNTELIRNYSSELKPLNKQQSVADTLQREFFGLRDFYSLIKMICSMCIESGSLPTWNQLEHAVLRNFSGLEGVNPILYIPSLDHIKSICDSTSEHSNIDSTPGGLIEATLKSHASLEQRRLKPYQENRFLLYITDNNSALRILETKLAEESPFVLYGSSFPKDNTYTQVCRNVNQIKIHMESGEPVILLNLENIYESLYDLLNQCYTVLPRGRYVDLGMRTHRIKCRVNDRFRLIIIAERSKVFSSFPSALINRLEKHFVLSSTFLNPDQLKIEREVNEWVEAFSRAKNAGSSFAYFTPGDAFVGFQRDTVASVVIQASELVKKRQAKMLTDYSTKEKCCDLLLQLVSHDALARLPCTLLGQDKQTYQSIHNTYFEKQKHSSLRQVLNYYTRNCKAVMDECLIEDNGVMLQVSTYGLLLHKDDLKHIAKDLDLFESNVKLLSLREFDTEMEFSSKVRRFFSRDSGNYSEERLLLVQCDSGHLNTDLIACARYRVIDEHKQNRATAITNVVFIIQLPRVSRGTSFASFLGGPWISIHVDNLHGSEDDTAVLKFALQSSVGEFFRALITKTIQPSEAFNPTHLLRNCIQKALSELNSFQFKERAEKLINILQHLIRSVSLESSLSGFSSILCEKVCKLLEEQSDELYYENPQEWAVKEAMNAQRLQSNYTLVDAVALRLQERLKEMLMFLVIRLDHNYNLDILEKNEPDSPLYKLWISAFEDERIVQLDYNQLYASKTSGVTPLYKYQLTCSFPFSSDVIPQIESSLATIVAQGEMTPMKIHRMLCGVLSKHPLNKMFQIEDQSTVLMLRDLYMNDFLLVMVEGAKDISELLSTIINSTIESDINHQESSLSLLSRIASIHVAYYCVKTEVYWILQLCRIFPEHQTDFQSFDCENGILLYWNAVKTVIEALLPSTTNQSLKLATRAQRQQWVTKIHVSRNVIESILCCKIPTNTEAAKIQSASRGCWLRLQTLYLLMEHVIIELDDDFPSLEYWPQRMYNLLINDDQFVSFSDKSILKIVLMSMINVLTSLFRKHYKVSDLQCSNCSKQMKISEILVFPCTKSHEICIKCYDNVADDWNQACPTCKERRSIYTSKPWLPDCEKEKLIKYSEMQRNCCDFFVEWLSQVCFSSNSPEPPNDDFVEELTQIAATIHDTGDLKGLLPIDELTSHNTDVIQSFLIQILLDKRPKKSRKLLQNYVDKDQQSKTLHIQDSTQFFLLCMKSMERVCFKQYSQHLSLVNQIEFATTVLNDGQELLTIHGSTVKSMAYMESIARIRFVLCITADICHDYLIDTTKYEDLPRQEKTAIKQLIVRVSELCANVVMVPEDCLKHFIIKQVVKGYGYTCWLAISQHELLKTWITPSTLKFAGESATAIRVDPFSLYGEEYTTLRGKMVDCCENFDQCLQEIQLFEGNNSASVLFALFKYFDLQHAKKISGDGLILKLLLQMKHSIQSSDSFCAETKSIVGDADTDNLTEEADFSPHIQKYQKLLLEVVVHAVGTLPRKTDFLRVLLMPLHDLQALQTTFLPAMPEEALGEILNVLSKETLWECPNGHKYFIGDCGRPWTTARCPVKNCDAEIGGILHRASQETTEIERRNVSVTKFGHTLGEPFSRQPCEDYSETELTQTILRLLLHSVYFWASLVSNQSTRARICNTISVRLKANELLNFFWHHMEKDLEILSHLIERNETDAALLVHTVLHSPCIQHPVVDGDFSCQSKQSKALWEREFQEHYIRPISDDLKSHLDKAQQSVLNDATTGLDELFRMVSEQDVKSRITDMSAQLWSYHRRITSGHILHVLSTRRDGSFKFLQEFLKMELVLRAVQYLPDIVQVVKTLHEVCHYRLSRQEASQTPIVEFSKKWLPVEHRQKGFDSKVLRFCTAWNIVRDVLPSDVPDKYKKIEFSPETPLTYFISHDKEEGVCSIKLISYLARLQNAMIKFSSSISGYDKSSCGDYNMPLENLHKCHVIDHEQHLEQVILSHCLYSLLAGHGYNVRFNFHAMEKHILDAFICGKPYIHPATVPATSYRGDATKSNVFLKVRKNIAQVQLTTKEKGEIIAEVTREHTLHTAIEMVNIALGFLTYTKLQQVTLLSRYVRDVLKMDHIFTPKANAQRSSEALSKVEQYCTVGHAISLWKVLCVQNARQLTLDELDPFPDVHFVFKDQLTEQQQSKLFECLGKYDESQFLESMYEFIATYVQHETAESGAHTLGLEERFADEANNSKINAITNFNDKTFPDTILLGQVVCVWKYAALYYLNKRE